MDLMQIRRGLLMQINGRIPANMAVDIITVVSATSQTMPHSLSDAPDAIAIFPVNMPTGTGAVSPYVIIGTMLGGGGYGDCPNKLVTNQSNASGNWDYSGTNQGWRGDSQNVYLSFNNPSRMPTGDYVLVTYKYE